MNRELVCAKSADFRGLARYPLDQFFSDPVGDWPWQGLSNFSWYRYTIVQYGIRSLRTSAPYVKRNRLLMLVEWIFLKKAFSIRQRLVRVPAELLFRV